MEGHYTARGKRGEGGTTGTQPQLPGHASIHDHVEKKKDVRDNPRSFLGFLRFGAELAVIGAVMLCACAPHFLGRWRSNPARGWGASLFANSHAYPRPSTDITPAEQRGDDERKTSQRVGAQVDSIFNLRLGYSREMWGREVQSRWHLEKKASFSQKKKGHHDDLDELGERVLSAGALPELSYSMVDF